MSKLPSNLFLLYCITSLYFISTSADLNSEMSGLLTFRSTVRGGSLVWNISDPSPCNWTGVKCSLDKTHVTELHLPGMGLSGQIPLNSISALTNLTFLSLRYNALVSPLPNDLYKLSELKRLFLQNNLLNGSVPGCVFKLTKLSRLDLGDNMFSGAISGEFGNLKGLEMLYLQNNNFSGTVPDLDLPKLVLFNVSNNNGLSGKIPERLSREPDEAFSGTELCGKPLDACDADERREGKKLSLILASVFGPIVGVVLILVFCYVYC